MIKTSSSSDETKRLRAAEKKKEENRNAKRLKYYHENKESINRKLREKRAEAKRLKAAAERQVDENNTASNSSCKPKKYDWALYKRNQRAKAREEMKKKTTKKKKEKGERGNDSGTAYCPAHCRLTFFVLRDRKCQASVIFGFYHTNDKKVRT